MKKVSVIAAAVATALMAGSAIAAEASLEERVQQLEAQLAETQTVAEENQAAVKAEEDNGVEFFGYARQGVVYNTDGQRLDKGGFHDQGAFFHPQSPYLHTYRLGNEPANYLEAGMSKKFTMDDGAWAKFNTRLATHQYYSSTAYQGNSYDDNDLQFREVYAEMGGLDVLPEGSSVWAGKRYYGRQDIYMSDFLYRIYDGVGAGIQNISAGSGSFDIAYISSDLNGEKDPETSGTVTQHNLLVKYSGIKALGGSIAVEGVVSLAPNREKETPVVVNGQQITKGAENGYSLGVTYGRGDFFGFGDGWSTVAVMAGTGLASTFDSSALWIDNEDALGVRAVAYGLWDVSDKWNIMAELVYDVTDEMGTGADETNTTNGGYSSSDYYAFGVMPVYKVTQHFSIESQFSAEFGSTDFSGNQAAKVNDTSAMYKATIAPTLTLDAGNFWAKPVVRAFATYASWDEEASNGGTAGYGAQGKTNGMTYGVQMEVWF